MNNRVLIFIPTYNEAENIKLIYQLIKLVVLPEPFDIMFLDDNSPDGTGAIIDTIVKSDSQVFAIHRKGKSGIGSAHSTGISWASEHNYHKLITMDCDLTHSPEYIEAFYRASKDASVVIGSRYLETDSLNTWNYSRKFLTRFGHFLTKNLLSMPYDASGAFRLYNLTEIKPGIFHLIQSKSYSFFFESLLILHLNNVKIKEIAIKLPKRTYGDSKMSFKDAFISFKFLFKMFRKNNFQRNTLILK